MSPEDAITVLPTFNSKQEEYYWVAKRLKNITDDELDPDDILVIFPDSLTSFQIMICLIRYYETLESIV